MPDDPEEMFEKMRHMLGIHKHKVVKTIQPTENEAAQMMTLVGYQKAAETAAGLHNSMKKRFWAEVEIRTGEVTRSLHWNDKKGVIEVMECDHSGGEDDEKDGKDWES